MGTLPAQRREWHKDHYPKKSGYLLRRFLSHLSRAKSLLKSKDSIIASKNKYKNKEEKNHYKRH